MDEDTKIEKPDPEKEPTCHPDCRNLPLGDHQYYCEYYQWNQKRKPRLA